MILNDSMIIMTGLSGAGKSTLANSLQAKLTLQGIAAEVLDGDHYRRTAHKGLGFSAADRRENIARLASVAHEKDNQGIVPIVAAINPFEDQRCGLANTYNAKIVWVRCDLQKLIERDTKGLYRKALLPDDHPDKISNLTGVNDPYEPPLHPDLVIDTSETPVEVSAGQLFEYVIRSLGL
jgi:adenylylsulfate kinase